MIVAPHNLEAEQAILGAILLSGGVIGALAAEMRLRADHFYREQHRLVYQAMLALADAGAQVDVIALVDQLRRDGTLEAVGGESHVHALASLVPAAGNVRHYAGIVMDLADLRRIQQAAQQILAGVDARDRDAIAEAEGRLAGREPSEQRSRSADELAQDFHDSLEAGDPETFAWPFRRLNDLTNGGMRRGQMTIVAGHTGHGKSVIVDQCLETAAQDGHGVHLYINEMTPQERTARTVSRLAGVPFPAVMANRLDDGDQRRIVQSLNRGLPFGITECSGWNAQEISRDVKRHGYDVVAVDMFNGFPHRDTADRDESSRLLKALTQPSQANCHLLVAAHLNRNRSGQSLVLPFPSLADIRDTGMLGNDAHNVMFVHRDQDPETGDPLVPGVVRFAKVRNGERGGLSVRFDGRHMRFRDAGSRPVAEQDAFEVAV